MLYTTSMTRSSYLGPHRSAFQRPVHPSNLVPAHPDQHESWITIATNVSDDDGTDSTQIALMGVNGDIIDSSDVDCPSSPLLPVTSLPTIHSDSAPAILISTRATSCPRADSPILDVPLDSPQYLRFANDTSSHALFGSVAPRGSQQLSNGHHNSPGTRIQHIAHQQAAQGVETNYITTTYGRPLPWFTNSPPQAAPYGKWTKRGWTGVNEKDWLKKGIKRVSQKLKRKIRKLRCHIFQRTY